MKCSDFTIMFAEDEPGIRKIYERNFVKEGYKVVLVEHGARAMAELREQKIDLLVTDLAMPGMNTLELFPILKKEYPRLPVIVVTGHYLNLQEDFVAKGFDIKAVFNKPVGISELKEKVRRILKISEVDRPEKKTGILF
ncbi:MAG TPA: response regulator [bacterium]|nr:response regulator [bacterium]